MARVKGLAHLVLRVRDLGRSVDFYTRVLGLKVTAQLGSRMAFLSASEDKSHELALLSLGDGVPGPDPRRVGLYHFAWQVESVEALQDFYRHLEALQVPILGVGDHGISLGIYFTDPDGNEIEVFYELPPDQWPKEGNIFGGRFPIPVELGT